MNVFDRPHCAGEFFGDAAVKSFFDCDYQVDRVQAVEPEILTHPRRRDDGRGFPVRTRWPASRSRAGWLGLRLSRPFGNHVPTALERGQRAPRQFLQSLWTRLVGVLRCGSVVLISASHGFARGRALKQVFITGASRGIGAAAALAMGGAGYRVWLHYRSHEAAARNVSKAIVDTGGPEPHLVHFDISDRHAADTAICNLLETLGAPDAVVLNAGITRNALFAMTDDAQWDEVVATNLGSFLAIGRPVVKAMVRERKGRIVLLSSVAAQRGSPGQVAYAATKGALISAARSLALELAPRGITVNVVSPGLIKTEMLEGAPVSTLLPLVPLGRVGQPREVAHVIRYLCSEEAGFVTGQVLGVNGGLWMS